MHRNDAIKTKKQIAKSIFALLNRALRVFLFFVKK